MGQNDANCLIIQGKRVHLIQAMTRILIILLVSLLLFSENSCATPTSILTNNATNTNIDTNQNISKLKKTISRLNTKIAVANSDINLESNRFSDIQTYFEVFAFIFTFFTAFVSVITFYSIRSDVKDKAESYAKEWFHERSSDVESRIDDFRRKSEELMIDFYSFIDTCKLDAEKTIGDKNTIIEPSQENTTTGHEMPEKEQHIYNNNSEVVTTQDAIIVQSRPAIETELLEQVAMATAMLNKAIRLGKLNRSEEAIAEYDALINKFGSATETELLKQVAKAMLNKGATLGQQNRSEEEIVEYDALIKKFGSATEAELLKQVAMAMLNKAIRLGKLALRQIEWVGGRMLWSSRALNRS